MSENRYLSLTMIEFSANNKASTIDNNSNVEALLLGLFYILRCLCKGSIVSRTRIKFPSYERYLGSYASLHNLPTWIFGFV